MTIVERIMTERIVNVNYTYAKIIMSENQEKYKWSIKSKEWCEKKLKIRSGVR